jgi:hypothetical protein
MDQRDPKNWRHDLPNDTGVLAGILAALLIAIGLLMFWPRSETNPATAFRDNGPRTERTPTTPAPQPPKPPAQ